MSQRHGYQTAGVRQRPAARGLIEVGDSVVVPWVGTPGAIGDSNLLEQILAMMAPNS